MFLGKQIFYYYLMWDYWCFFFTILQFIARTTYHKKQHGLIPQVEILLYIVQNKSYEATNFEVLFPFCSFEGIIPPMGDFRTVIFSYHNKNKNKIITKIFDQKK